MSSALPAAPSLSEIYNHVYSTDLVYQRDCWKLCGDAHCCSFARYKARFRLIGRTPFQELPLLPGEYDYLNQHGLLAQFGDFDHRVNEYSLNRYTMRIESIVSRRPQCACDHDIRPVVCRLYPLLPVFDVDGRCVSTEPLGIYEELEQMAQLPTACQLQAFPFEEVQKFLTITSQLARHPLILFYLEAYRLTKQHVAHRLQAARTPDRDVFALFESSLVRDRLINHDELRPELDQLLTRFRRRYGFHFTKRLAALPLTASARAS